jgi:N-acetyl-gamma-glutamyl-phosphate reductase
MSRTHAGKPVHAVHPNLRGLLNQEFVAEVDWDWIAAAERPVLFCAMPHGELARQFETLSKRWPPQLTVIDLSADFRIASPERYARHYGAEHPAPRELMNWSYGFRELNFASLAGARRIANPGCFASALQLALYPLTGLSGIRSVSAFGVTGSSGSGATPSETTHHPTRSSDFRAYKPLAHQHMAEVEQMLERQGANWEVAFVPHSAPMVRGIFVTIQAEFASPEQARGATATFEAAYRETPFVRLVEGSPRVAAVAGTNFADIGLSIQNQRLAVMAVLDNLGKGMAGQAVQNMNLALGFEETEGLWFAAGFPY